MNTVDIQNLSVHYGSKTVLENISFNIEAGQCLVIRGESGTGKTTLGKALAGKLNYTGQISFSLDPHHPFSDTVLFVDSWYRFTNLEGDSNFYYQQRYNHQQRRDTVTIGRELEMFGKEHHLEEDHTPLPGRGGGGEVKQASSVIICLRLL